MALTLISVLSLFLTALYLAAVIFFRYGWKRNLSAPQDILAPKTLVSILIAARNEEDKIADTINDIISQDYPNELVELIVIDDHSTDRTADIISGYSHRGVILLKLNESEPLNSYKKKAIAEGIRLAKGELLVTTDADCRMGNAWLKTIVAHYERYNYKLISSPVVFFEEKSFFERLQTLEFLYLIGLGAATIGNKRPSTCNGANLAYRKDVFVELKGFQGIDELASGDDELFLHKVASKYPRDIGFCKSYEALVYTHAKPNLKEFIRQRKRWASKSTKYKDKKIVALGVSIWLFNLLIVINAVLGFYYPGSWLVLVIVLIVKCLAEMYFLIPVTAFVKRKELLFYLPLLTYVHAVYIIYIGVAGNTGKYIWKGRLVK
ncbi:MAG: glycosyltransferase [Sphingobacteriaceae bacterium]|nr:glycosyltransferase [Sphingobacteriaceae bacterium]